MKKTVTRLTSIGLALSMIGGFTACTGQQSAPTESTSMTTIPSQIETSATTTEKELPYKFGLGETFHANEPTTYTMFFSDASWYPMIDKWKTEGIFKEIENRTNVHLDIKSYDSGDYMNNITLDINAGKSAYIIPKIYDDTAFVDGGAIVPISDYVQYMPYYTDFYNKYNLSKDIQTITRANGKYYKLPGMKEGNLINYTFMIRKDIWDKAGVDVVELEKTWTWGDLLEALKKVKAYMVEQGMCKEKDYIWSDLWCGNESGKGSGGNLLGVMGATYDVNAGWNIGNGMRYNPAADEFQFSPVSDNFKEFLKAANAFIEAGILDPETFTQDDATATAQYFNGKTAIMSVNQSQFASFEGDMVKQLGEGKFENYCITLPMGSTKNSTVSPERLENGVMIADQALKDLGEDGFIEMLRFVDWLFYSHEAYELTKWGVEGVHYEVDADGYKHLKEGFCCSGLGYGNTPDNTLTDIRFEWGYAGGNFWYGGTIAEMEDNLVPKVQDYVHRDLEYREVPPLAPGIAPTSDQYEKINLIATPLISNVNTWVLKFVTGQADVEKQWDEYVASCEELNYKGLVDLYAQIYQK
ncbi:MAG: extracellular solute-binding protein [Saccharofermentans sp.]|nr:extracellular solute-binding protein [Saccharofermentans sp.]